ncbi:GNAT family N-acetyltransferase [Rhodovulum sp. YNF3179]|jgi:ribosomal protein S18 acetylase RimI-like enzyme|uniref:GNAT family N-acetyltransferase n=1 Tax=Rhodovulum sp. YNF3179 TaxID=3425127 RepID=UPI003D3548E0
MDGIAIRQATPADAGRLNAALAALSADLDDPHAADADLLARAISGAAPAAHALLAEGTTGLLGAALYSPLVSTARGQAGVYVSDLWIADAARGQGLGRRLLAAVARDAARRWRAGFIKLAVYEDNPRARAFYDRLGFTPAAREQYMSMQGAAFEALKGDP